MLKIFFMLKDVITIEVVGHITEYVETLLGITVAGDRNIYLGETNVIHMQSDHPKDFKKYGDHITVILSDPDYIRLHKKNGSIEYVKEFLCNDEYVKVAVRLSGGNRFYARSLYVLNTERVKFFIENGELKPIQNKT